MISDWLVRDIGDYYSSVPDFIAENMIDVIMLFSLCFN